MSVKDLLHNLPFVTLEEERAGLCIAYVHRDQFAISLDELVNCRSLVSATSVSGRERDSHALISQGLTLAHLYVTDDVREKGTFSIHALLHDDTSCTWLLLSSSLDREDPEYQSVSRFIMAAAWFERYNHDLFGVTPTDHPDLRRLVHHEHVPLELHPLKKDFSFTPSVVAGTVPYPLLQVPGEGVYEVGVGPVHNRVAESVHHRLSTSGERIITHELKPFYKHKGIEKLVEGMTATQALPYLERVGSDAAFSHGLAYSQAVESILGTEVPERAKTLRTFFAEIERVMLHIEDIANMAGIGAGYSRMKAGFNLRERLMRLSEKYFENRFFRGVVVPGGLSRDFSLAEVREIEKEVLEVIEEIETLVFRALKSDGLRDRLETTGVLRKDAAMAYGAVGPIARASGVDEDVRRDHPYAAYGRFPPRVVTHSVGDVFARFVIRADELRDSKRLLIDLAKNIAEGPVKTPCHPESGYGISAVESPRGELLYVVIMREGKITRLAMKDPSFMNFPLLHEAVPTNALSDFPLITRSFGLSPAECDK